MWNSGSSIDQPWVSKAIERGKTKSRRGGKRKKKKKQGSAVVAVVDDDPACAALRRCESELADPFLFSLCQENALFRVL
jgi:hypothetical protein